MPKQPQQAPAKKRFTQKGHYRGMKHEYGHLHSQYGGFHSKTVVQSVARCMIAERRSQFLTHLATALKAWYRKVSDASEIEIQIAIFNDNRMLIASNKNETAEYFYADVIKKSAGTFLESLKDVAAVATKAVLKSKATDSVRVRRHSTKAVKEILGTRKVGLPYLHELQEEGSKICVKFDACEDISETFAAFLNGAMADKHVAILTSTRNMHAEQKMLLALCKASSALTRAEPIIIAGTFRPCRGCYESLSVVQRYCFQNLQFGVRPGHYWDTTTRAHVEIVNLLRARGLISDWQFQSEFDANGLLIGLTNTSHRAVLRVPDGDQEALHFASDSDSSDDST